MTDKRGRLVKASAAFGAAGAGVVLTAAPAAAAPMVTPTTGLHDGQSVSVTWGPSVGGPTYVSAVECSGPVPAGIIFGPTLDQCDGSTGSQLSQVRGSGSYQGNILVRKSIAPPSGAVTCTNQCSIVVVASYANQTPPFAEVSGSVPITFK